METIRLQLLGPPSIERDGQPAPPFKSRRVLALLAYLTLNPGAHPRSKLAGLLWSDSSEKTALDNLRYALWNLQRALGASLFQTDRLTAALQHSDILTFDVDEFQQALDLATTARDPNAPEVIAALQRAVDLYRGDLLADLDLPGDPLFNEWLRLERACRREGMAGVLDRLGIYHTARGELPAAMAVTRRLLGMEPWREEAHRRMMLLLARAGQRSAALAQYQTCRRLLAEELGVEPLEETTALYERILKAEVEEQEEASLRQAAPHLPFVGRLDEHNRLVTWWEAARRGESRLALVQGEAGVGKTRLVEEVIGYAELRGAAALRGRCYEFGGGLPYQPIADALRSAPGMGASTPTHPHLHALPNLALRTLAPAARTARTAPWPAGPGDGLRRSRPAAIVRGRRPLPPGVWAVCAVPRRLAMGRRVQPRPASLSGAASTGGHTRSGPPLRRARLDRGHISNRGSGAEPSTDSLAAGIEPRPSG